MRGMKEGAGEDPFADDDEPEESSSEIETAETTTTMPESTTNSAEQSHMELPYKYRRDGVQDERDRVPLFLQEATKQVEKDARRDLEAELGEDVPLTDLREALLLAGAENLGVAAETLREWGFDWE